MSEAVFEERFIKLVEDNGGFEYYQAYRGLTIVDRRSRLPCT